MNHQERISEHAKMADRPTPDGTSCPEAPKLPCDLWDIAYATSSTQPRMYGRCDRCGTHYAFLLPSRSAPKNPTIEGAFCREQKDTVFVDACESVFTTNGVAQRIGYLLQSSSFGLRRDVITEIEKWVERDVYRSITARERQLTELLKLVEERSKDLWLELGTCSYRETRGAAAKARLALANLKAETRREEQRLAQRRSEYAGVLASIHQAREHARLEPLPKPEVASVDAVVLCDRLAPSEVIYALVDPTEPNLVRYVGRTYDPVHRYRVHCTNGTDAVTAWAESVMEGGRRPVMVLLERCERGDVEQREAHWIHYYRDRFQADLNRAIPRRLED